MADVGFRYIDYHPETSYIILLLMPTFCWSRLDFLTVAYGGTPIEA